MRRAVIATTLVLLVASVGAFCDDGMPHRAIAISRPSGALRTIGAG